MKGNGAPEKNVRRKNILFLKSMPVNKEMKTQTDAETARSECGGGWWCNIGCKLSK